MSVLNKYERRIKRFYYQTKSPTLFIRQVRNAEDLTFIEENYDKISDVIKKLNSANHCVFVMSNELAKVTKLAEFFVTKNDKRPIIGCKLLKKYLSKTIKISFLKRVKNKYKHLCKAVKKRFRG